MKRAKLEIDHENFGRAIRTYDVARGTKANDARMATHEADQCAFDIGS